MPKVKVLFVCLGNICRSPLAEAIFQTKVANKKLNHLVEVNSCGTANYHVGDLPDPRTISNAKKNGVVINHRGRQLSSTDLDYYDFILAMDRSNYKNILSIDGATNHSHKVSLLRKFSNEPEADVPDPYYGGEREFQNVFDILDRAIDSFVDYLEDNHLKV